MRKLNDMGLKKIDGGSGSGKSPVGSKPKAKTGKGAVGSKPKAKSGNGPKNTSAHFGSSPSNGSSKKKTFNGKGKTKI